MTLSELTARQRRSAHTNGPILHPIFFALYAILAMLAANFQELTPDQAIRSLLIVPVGVLGLFGLLNLVYRDWHRAGLAASLLVLAFFSYGHLYLSLETVQVAGVILGRHRYLIPGFSIVAGVALIWLWKARTDLRPVTRLSNLVSATAVGLTLVSLSATLLRVRSSPTSDTLASLMLHSRLEPRMNEPLPDVYYIILDGYARSDYMHSVFDFDNSDFLSFLESRGFYVAENSHANHNWTALSLSSSLNMVLAQDLGLPLRRGSYPAVFVRRIRDGLVRANFERLGYEIVALRSGHIPTEWIDADRYLVPDNIDTEWMKEPLQFNAFEGMLLQSSAGLILMDLAGESLQPWTGMGDSAYGRLREIILYELEMLPEVAATPGPKFVFAHIVSPHAPYLFGPDGEEVAQTRAFTLVEPGQDDALSGSARRYADQAAFITAEIEAAIDGILANSSVPPIIILQSDHGSGAAPGWRSVSGEGLRQRMSILNAYRLPESCQSQLYPSITPVNSFRLIFNCVYGADYPLLPDDTYFSPWPYESGYSFILVNDRLH